ncbi:compatible solute transport protein (probable substrate choline/glycine betaine) [Natronomonas pharaonis DSM 2160]|uniref:Compatible solute transport protein (Probable substrate choline/glycine betaine) n=1 Tax=Natronomonas pharaonis (strain ATCC 35678 / DSM 2160 / CIP 103997 / JCM 8858 / NBRC 14720 / NCIMB 2260 / Gabara) TaxID=348780 RepID=A0A1U7EXH6_NATPD|nr:BCCT family transporter [Natronomonas pharaonis]CAI49885.1 compatible solute transport protein (probable substrate choline/glycine betaine) [Natronomonas pharaonis DSM 2160]
MSQRPSSVSESLRSFINELDPVPFLVGAVISVGFVIYTAYDVAAVQAGIDWAFGTLGERLAWLYLAGMLALIVLAAYLMVSSYGSVTLGTGPPEYSYPAYVAMFFSAGLSAGIVFFGPAEALGHYQTPPPLFEGSVGPASEGAIVPAVAYTIFHYGLSAWGGYLAIGLPVAYFAYKYDAPFRVSTALYPVLGTERLDGVVARAVDTLAVVATIGGIATGLGFIATQLLTGITFETGRQFSDAETILAITGITVFFTLSLIAGVSRGIRRVSQFNIGLMVLLLLVALVAGPTLALLNTGVAALGSYGANFFQMSLFLGADGGAEWAAAWTVFYWSWWIAWAPFVGLFLARISRGRTIRTVVGTAFVTMTVTSAIWFTVVGGSSVWLHHLGVVDLLGPVGEFGNGIAGFVLFGSFTGGAVWQLLFFVLVTTFFVTSADSSTLALGMLTTGGERAPSKANRAFWGVLQGVIASVLVVVGGATALRSSVIVTGAPFAVVCLVALAGFVYWLWADTPEPSTQGASGASVSDD